jgi:biopolymer transport protein ExbB/biopolymer transport protein TolQ
MQNAWYDAAVKMGAIARGVATVHLIMSITLVTIAVLKWRDLRDRARATRGFADAFAAALAAGNVPLALSECASHAKSQVAVVLGASLRAASPFVGRREDAEYAASIAEIAADREQVLVTGQLRSGLNALAAIGATATLLGLLGTVVGIFNSFASLARSGGGSVEAIAGGAGEALLTTALGLVVAIPALWLYTYFAGRLERASRELDYAVQELIEWIMLRGGPSPAGATSPAAG